MRREIRAKFDITDEEALYIKQVTEEKAADPAIRGTVRAHRDDRMCLEGAYRGRVNGEIQLTHNELARYEELAEPRNVLCTPARFPAMSGYNRHLNRYPTSACV